MGRPVAARTRSRLRRLIVALVVVLCAFGLALLTRPVHSGPALDPGALKAHPSSTRLAAPKKNSLSPLRARIVAIAESQVGYATDPSGTYCNKYSAFWSSGTDDCGNSNLDEEWCSDFAAWVWHQAGAAVTYQYVNGDLNSSAASFYEWGRARGTWHPVGSGYEPQPGDVAVYGLNQATLVAAHVSVVVGYVRGHRGPNAVNGDGDLTGFSVVEARTDEYFADTHPDDAALSGYVSPSQPVNPVGSPKHPHR